MSALLEGDRLKLGAQVLTTGPTKQQLTVLSPVHLILVGDKSGQVVALPSALTLKDGWVYIISNQSSKVVVVKDFLGTTVANVNPEQRVDVILTSAATPRGEWAKSVLNISGNPMVNSMFALDFQATGLAKGRWLAQHKSIDSDKVAAAFPFGLSRLVAASFSNSQEDTSADVLIYKNGTTDLNVYHTWSVRKEQSSVTQFGKELLFAKGSTLSVFVNNVSSPGNIPENPLVTLYFQIISA